jgi:hypothetical protein
MALKSNTLCAVWQSDTCVLPATAIILSQTAKFKKKSIDMTALF